MKKTRMIRRTFEIFGWKILDGFDVLKLYLYRLPAKATKVSEWLSFFGKKSIYLYAGRKKNIFFHSRHRRVSNRVTDAQKYILW